MASAAAYGRLRWGRICKGTLALLVCYVFYLCSTDARVQGSTDEIGLAFFVQVSSQNAPLLPQLMATIYHPDNLYMIHFDLAMTGSSLAMSRQSIDQFLTFDNIHESQPRDYVSWGGISQVLNILSGISAILEIPKAWTHLIFVAPSNYPLVAASDMRELLAEYPQSTFMGWGVQSTAKAPHSFINYIIDPATANLSNPSATVLIPESLPWYSLNSETVPKGGAWRVLTKRTCEYLVLSPMTPKRIVQLSNLASVDEYLFTELIYRDAVMRAQNKNKGQSNYSQVLRNDNLHHIVWRHPKLVNPDWRHPFVLNSIEMFWEGLAESGALFTRKVDQSKGSMSLVAKIDSEIIGNESFVSKVRARMMQACLLSQGNDCS